MSGPRNNTNKIRNQPLRKLFLFLMLWKRSSSLLLRLWAPQPAHYDLFLAPCYPTNIFRWLTRSLIASLIQFTFREVVLVTCSLGALTAQVIVWFYLVPFHHRWMVGGQRSNGRKRERERIEARYANLRSNEKDTRMWSRNLLRLINLIHVWPGWRVLITFSYNIIQ